MIKEDFKIPQEYIVLCRFLFWTAIGAGVFVILLKTNFWTGFVDSIGWAMARVAAKYEWRFLAEDPHTLRLVFHIIPSIIQAVCAGMIAGGIVGYTVRSSVDLRAVLIGCLLVFIAWNVYPFFYFVQAYETIAASADDDLLIKVLEMQGIGKSEGLGGIEFTLSNMLEYLKINMLMLASLLVSAYFFRRIYFLRMKKKEIIPENGGG